MRLVLDTNTALSGLLWDGTPARLIDAAADGRATLAALDAGAALIVSGDAHLLDLKQYHGMPIVTAAQALRRLRPAP